VEKRHWKRKGPEANMASQWVNERDSKFLLHEVLKIDQELLGKAPFTDIDPEMVDMVVDGAARFAEGQLAPQYPDEAHGKPVEAVFKDNIVRAPEAYKELWKQFAEGGWLTISDGPEVGGQGLPGVVAAACNEFFYGCNQAFSLIPMLTVGSARLIGTFCSDQVKAIFIPKMFGGTWSGTMCLTEPVAGSDVGALKATAKRNTDGTYSIAGTKCFITGGDHDLTENIVHIVLARVVGDPPGTAGISIFVIPKHRVKPDGSVGEPNDVITGNIEHKMGIHGSPTCTLNFGENGKCIGYLMGREREGMKVMFHLMNEERQNVGMMGVGLAGSAYLHALAYAKDRLQGSNSTARTPGAQVPIIQHPDVRRMLLTQKSVVEGIRSLCFYCYSRMDKAKAATTEDEKARCQGLIEILTPIVKAYCTDMGMMVNHLAVQTHGGYGYCRDYPVEQMQRDQRINSIYEGTNGIQAVDLVGRKLGMGGGKLVSALLDETKATIAEALDISDLRQEAQIVETAVEALARTSSQLGKLLRTNPSLPLLAAGDLLNCFGDTLCGWLHLWMALTAKKALARAESESEQLFYQGKIEGAKFFVNRITSLVPAKCEILSKEETSAMRIPEGAFAA
jgi:alkylation response protein AidB-like acyl-CoA dehydrogenase